MTRRPLTREQVIAYCAISPNTFLEWRARGVLPDPVPGTFYWDRDVIDEHLAELGFTRQSAEDEIGERIEMDIAKSL